MPGPLRWRRACVFVCVLARLWAGYEHRETSSSAAVGRRQDKAIPSTSRTPICSTDTADIHVCLACRAVTVIGTDGRAVGGHSVQPCQMMTAVGGALVTAHGIVAQVRMDQSEVLATVYGTLRRSESPDLALATCAGHRMLMHALGGVPCPKSAVFRSQDCRATRTAYRALRPAGMDARWLAGNPPTEAGCRLCLNPRADEDRRSAPVRRAAPDGMFARPASVMTRRRRRRLLVGNGWRQHAAGRGRPKLMKITRAAYVLRQAPSG